MNRRTFTKSGAVLAGAALLSKSGFAKTDNTSLTAQDVQNHLRSLCEVAEPSVDRIIIGDPNTKVTKIGTCWMPYWKTLKNAVAQGINTLIVHEPTFYAHWEKDMENIIYSEGNPDAQQAYAKLRNEKIDWINQHELVIIRCHDVWDKLDDIGIPYSLGQALGFTNEQIIRSKTYYNIYKIDPTPAQKIAEQIAKQLKTVNQPGVAFYGDPDYTVSTIGIGTGCICDPLAYMELQPDMFIGIDDTIRTWIQTVYAEDSGQPLVVINHGTSEEFGMRSLNEYLNKTYPKHDVIHLDQGCSYKWITG